MTPKGNTKKAPDVSEALVDAVDALP